jgi:hypothetical protein
VQIEPGLAGVNVRTRIDQVDVACSYATVALLQDNLIRSYGCRALLEPRRSGDNVGIGLRIVIQSVAVNIHGHTGGLTLRAQSVQLSLQKLLLGRHFRLARFRPGMDRWVVSNL